MALNCWALAFETQVVLRSRDPAPPPTFPAAHQTTSGILECGVSWESPEELSCVCCGVSLAVGYALGCG